MAESTKPPCSWKPPTWVTLQYRHGLITGIMETVCRLPGQTAFSKQAIPFSVRVGLALHQKILRARGYQSARLQIEALNRHYYAEIGHRVAQRENRARAKASVAKRQPVRQQRSRAPRRVGSRRRRHVIRTAAKSRTGDSSDGPPGPSRVALSRQRAS